MIMDSEFEKTLPLGEQNVHATSDSCKTTNNVSDGHDAKLARFVALSGWEEGRVIELSTKEFLVGRGNTADIQINVPSVSREHAMIRCGSDETGSYFTITDLGSSNGTCVNGTYTTETRLKSGDSVQLGDVMLKYYE